MHFRFALSLHQHWLPVEREFRAEEGGRGRVGGGTGEGGGHGGGGEGIGHHYEYHQDHDDDMMHGKFNGTIQKIKQMFTSFS